MNTKARAPPCYKNLYLVNFIKGCQIMKLTFNLTVEQATGTTTPIVVSVADDVEWTDGPDGKRHPGAHVGSRYTVLMQQNECAPLVVRTPELTPAVSAEEVAAACLAGQFIRVRFENFTATPYQGKNGMGVSGTAEKCVVVTPATGTTGAKS